MLQVLSAPHASNAEELAGGTESRPDPSVARLKPAGKFPAAAACAVRAGAPTLAPSVRRWARCVTLSAGLSQFWPNSADDGRISVESLFKFGRFRARSATSGRIRADLAEVGPNSVEAGGPRLNTFGQFAAKFCHVVGFGPELSQNRKCGQNRSRLGRIRAQISRIWSNIGRKLPNLASFRRKSVEFAPDSVESFLCGRNRRRLAEIE